MESLGRAIAQRREELGMGQSDLAARVGVSQQTVSRWESGHAVPRPSRIGSLAEVLGLERTHLHRAAGYLPDDGPQPDEEAGVPALSLRTLSEPELLELIDRAWQELLSRRRRTIPDPCAEAAGHLPAVLQSREQGL